MSTSSDDVNELELSVGLANLLQNAGVRRVSHLRKLSDADLRKMGFRVKYIKEVKEVLAETPPLTKEQLRQIEERESAARLVEARRVFSTLKTEERVVIFREFSRCTCSVVVKAVVDHPRIAIGAGLGALAAAVLTKLPPKDGRPSPNFHLHELGIGCGESCKLGAKK